MGTRVCGLFGWQEYVVSDGKSLQKIAEDIDLPAAIGVSGVTGLTAYFGLNEIGQPRAGDTVLVSGAAGATGSVVVQLACIAGYLREGSLKHHETILEGFENMPEALMSLFRGDNIGKQLVHVSD